MGHYINRKAVIDPETGEIVKEQNWLGYDGFNDKGYKYRRNGVFIRYYFDSIPENLSEGAFMLLWMIAELMNEENVLVYRVKRKSKFSSIIYKPMTKDDIAERIRFHYGINKFNRCWAELNKHCIKKVPYYNDTTVWAVNPAIFSKCKQVPIWLYEEFKDYMNPHLSAITIKKLQDRVDNQYE